LKVYKSIEGLNFKNPVVTVGMFDGVHNGHIQVIKKLNEFALFNNGESVLVSFWPHPQMIFESNNSIRLLSTMDEKVKLLEKSGIDHFIILSFNREFANISYKSFVKEILVKKIKVKTLVVGYDHHFGKNREGNFDKLSELSEKYNFKVEKLDAQIIKKEKVSSSIIRSSIETGNIELANDYLGYIYDFSGFVVEGKRKGKSMGYPTANLFIRESYKLIPGTGVYAVKVKMDGLAYQGMMNIGFRPTIIEDNKQKTIEVHILDIDKDLYGKELTIKVLKKIRDEKKFNSINELKSQLDKDEKYIRQFLTKI